jgi:hypothetical protein
MRIAIFAVIVALAFHGLSRAQVVEREKSKATTEEKAKEQSNSKTQQIIRTGELTYSVGSLFFRQLAEFEAPEELQRSTTLNKELAAEEREDAQSLFLDPKQDGAWLKALRCRIFSTRQLVYGVIGGEYQFGSSTGSAYLKEPFAAAEMPSAHREIDGAASRNFGLPIRPVDFITCVNAYSKVVNDAVSRLVKSGRVEGDLVIVPNIQEAARLAFVEALRSAVPGVVPVNAFLELRQPIPGTNCIVPTTAGLYSNTTDFRCGSWAIRQRPLEARNNGAVVLSEAEVMGAKVVFTDGVSVAVENKAVTSKKNATSSKSGESKKAKVAR